MTKLIKTEQESDDRLPYKYSVQKYGKPRVIWCRTLENKNLFEGLTGLHPADMMNVCWIE